jgi:malate/lactate dehydrogenase
MVGRDGIQGVINIHLTEEEAKKLRRSAETLWECQSHLEILPEMQID